MYLIYYELENKFLKTFNKSIFIIRRRFIICFHQHLSTWQHPFNTLFLNFHSMNICWSYTISVGHHDIFFIEHDINIGHYLSLHDFIVFIIFSDDMSHFPPIYSILIRNSSIGKPHVNTWIFCPCIHVWSWNNI